MDLKSACATMQGLKRGIVTTSDSLDVDGRDLELMTGEGAVVKEMEAAAVAVSASYSYCRSLCVFRSLNDEALLQQWVCKQLGCPFVAIKAVTDIVDGEEATREEFESNLGQAARCASQPAKITMRRVWCLCPRRCCA